MRLDCRLIARTQICLCLMRVPRQKRPRHGRCSRLVSRFWVRPPPRAEGIRGNVQCIVAIVTPNGVHAAAPRVASLGLPRRLCVGQRLGFWPLACFEANNNHLTPEIENRSVGRELAQGAGFNRPRQEDSLIQIKLWLPCNRMQSRYVFKIQYASPASSNVPAMNSEVISCCLTPSDKPSESIRVGRGQPWPFGRSETCSGFYVAVFSRHADDI